MATKVKILCDTHQWVTRHATEERWDNDDTDQSHDIKGIEVAKDGDWGEIEVQFDIDPGRTYFLVSVIYDTGDSFGQYCGQIEHIDLYESLALAEKNARRIRDHARGEGDYFRKKDTLMLTTNGGTEYRCHPTWVGYFEVFQEARVTPVGVGPRSFT